MGWGWCVVVVVVVMLIVVVVVVSTSKEGCVNFVHHRASLCLGGWGGIKWVGDLIKTSLLDQGEVGG